MENQTVALKVKESKAPFYSGVVWIVSALSLATYGIIGITGSGIPGVEQLVGFLSNAEGTAIFLAAFLAVFIEGLYFVGSFFPGTTLIIIVTLLSQLVSFNVFLGTVSLIFIGWSLASAVNIVAAKMYYAKIAKLRTDTDFEVKDRMWVTWYPAFRANYEVAQVTEGGAPLKVFFSSVRVKFLVSLAAGLGALIVPFFIDIKKVSNEEGFLSVAVVAAISFIVGVIKLRRYFAEKRTSNT